LASPRLVPVEVAADVDVDRAVGAKLIENPREPALKELGPSGEQEVRVAALGHLAAGLGPVRQFATVDDDHGFEAIGQDASGAQPGHAGSDHNRRLSHMTGLRRGDGSLF